MLDILLFKKAIELAKDNLQAKTSICDLFFNPKGQFEIKEKKFLKKRNTQYKI